LRALHLLEQVFVLCAHSLHSVFQAFDLNARVSVVGKDVLLFDLKGADCLLCASFFVRQLLVLSLQKLVRVRTLAELLVHKPILARQRLDILRELCNLLGFQLGELRLLVDLFAQTVALLAQSFYFLLPLEQLALVVVFFAHDDAHLMLHIAELETLLLQLLARVHQFFCLLVQLALHVVKVAVEQSNALLQVADLLVFRQKLALVGLNVVEEHGAFVFAASARAHGLLQPLKQLILRRVEVLDQGAHPLDLGVQVFVLLLLSRQVFAGLAKVVLDARLFVLKQRQRLL